MNSIKRKQLVFKFLLILSPLIVLTLVEGVLRLFNYGGDRSLVIERTVGDKKVYALNENVTRRYFAQKDIVPAVYTEQTFEQKKSSRTYRIFCLGESTTYGYPYPPNLNFPVFLKQRLQTLFPDRTFEVINVGVTAISSYAVVDFVEELVNYEPDLFLLYMGHNEFYGALGAASTEGLGRNRKLIKFDLYMQNYKCYLLLRDIVFGVASLFHDRNDKSKEGQIMMARMIDKTNVPIGSQEHHFAIQSFIENTLEIIDVSRQHNVRLLASSLVSNLKDQPPFETVLMPEPKQITFDKYVTQGEEHRENGDSAKAAFLYSRAADVFKESADTHFILAHRYLALHDRETARQHFEEALDLDLMPFRARTEFNRALASICAEKAVPLVPMHEIFEMNSKDGIPGNEVFTEHVHPNHLGYFLMAKRFCISLYETDCITPKSAWDLSRNLSDEAYWKMSGITPLDVGIGAMRTQVMKKSWPFTQKVLPDSLRIPMLATPIDTVTYYHIGGKINWTTAHVLVARYLVRQGQYDAARDEYLAVLGVEPAHLEAHLGVAEGYVLQKNYEEARAWLEKASKFHPESPYPPARLGFIALAKQEHQSAVHYLEQAVALQETANTVTEDQFLEIKFQLAAAYAFDGRPEKAKNLLQQILVKKPGYSEAQKLFDEL